jgi:ribosomal protein L7Ae-like RNA K-turn-binding protein
LNASTKVISRDNASFCVLSSSCTDPAYVGHITKLCSARGIPLCSGVDSATLGSWAGLGTLDANGAARAVNKMVSCSCVVVKAPYTLLDTAPATTHFNTVEHLDSRVISDNTTARVVSDDAAPFSRAASADADARVVCDNVAALNHPSDTFQVLKSKLDTFQVLKSKPPTF